MYGADEKKAFEDMLAEIGEDSDEDETFGYSAAIASRSQAKSVTRADGDAESKSAQAKKPSMYDSGAKPAPSSSTGPSFQQRAQSFQMSKEDEEIARFGVDASQSAAQVQSEQISITKRWLTRSCSASEKSSMRCFVERERSSFGMQTTYRCYLENPNSNGGSASSSSSANGPDGAAAVGARFLMSAKKRVVNKTSYYLISLDLDAADDRGSESVLGKVRGNAIGSKYLITDHGLAPEKAVAPSMLRKELGVVSFEFDSGGPSRIEAWVPAVSSSNVAAVWQPDSEEAGMEAHIDEHSSSTGGKGAVDPTCGGRLVYLQNKAPKWDEAHGGHVLNFQGRVTESSVKNFQLCCAGSEDPDQVVLQFGRVGKHKFNMDLRHPLSPMQAFSICVACLDGKIADRKGYEYLRKLTSGAAAEAAGESGEVVGGEVAHNGVQAPIVRQGSMQGSSSFSGMLREALPSKQYLRDKLTRTFK